MEENMKEVSKNETTDKKEWKTPGLEKLQSVKTEGAQGFGPTPDGTGGGNGYS